LLPTVVPDWEAMRDAQGVLWSAMSAAPPQSIVMQVKLRLRGVPLAGQQLERCAPLDRPPLSPVLVGEGGWSSPGWAGIGASCPPDDFELLGCVHPEDAVVAFAMQLDVDPLATLFDADELQRGGSNKRGRIRVCCTT